VITKRNLNVKNAAIPGDRNVIKRKVEKILKYKDLRTETQRMWNVKARLIPVIKGANGTISESLRQYYSKQTRKARN
jgi:hypothetical protein